MLHMAGTLGGAHTVEVRVLGPFELEVDGHRLSVAPKERMLLSALALRADETMHLHEMATALWAELPPATLRKCVQAHVSRVRRRLEGIGVRDSASVLRTEGDGYSLAIDAERVDACRFERLVTEGRRLLGAGEFEGAADLLGAARDLWRGDPLVDLAETPVGQAERARMTELHLSGLEALFDATLACRQHPDVAGEIEALLADHPLRERLWGQLMLGLYRSGRQAEALRAYQRARSTLVEQLGIEPGPELRRLEADIVAQDHRLDLCLDPAPALRLGPDRPTVRRAAPLPAIAPPDGAPASPTVPHEPVGPPAVLTWAEQARVGPFVGRVVEVDSLEGAFVEAASGLVVVGCSGDDGVGKSRLLAEVASRLAAKGALVVAGQCVGGVSGQALRQGLDRWAGTVDTVDPSRWPASTARVLGSVSAGISDRTGVDATAEPPDACSTAAALASLVEHEQGPLPAVVLLDDFHLADEATIATVRYLVEGHQASSLLLVLAFRGGEAGAQPEVLDLLDDLHRLRTYRRLPVSPLSPDDGALLLAATLDTPGTGEWPGALTRLCVDLGGQPRYLLAMAEEIAIRRRAEGGHWVPLRLADLRIPSSIRDLVRRRLRQLEPAHRAVLSAAAVIGDGFDHRAVSTVAHLDDVVVGVALDLAARVGIVREVGPDRGTFASTLLGRVVREDVTVSQRARFERRLDAWAAACAA